MSVRGWHHHLRSSQVLSSAWPAGSNHEVCHPQGIEFISIVRHLHDGIFARVLDNEQCSCAFPVTNEVKQGCVLAPMLFSMMFSAMLTNAFNEDEHGIKVNYRTDDKFFSLKRLQTKTKVEGVLVHDFLFADDCSLSAACEAEMQQNMDQFSAACAHFGLIINTKKTQVLHQLPPQYPYMELSVTTNGKVLNTVDKFTYFGSVLPRDVHTDNDIDACIARARSVFGRLQRNV